MSKQGLAAPWIQVGRVAILPERRPGLRPYLPVPEGQRNLAAGHLQFRQDGTASERRCLPVLLAQRRPLQLGLQLTHAVGLGQLVGCFPHLLTQFEEALPPRIVHEARATFKSGLDLRSDGPLCSVVQLLELTHQCGDLEGRR